jgi:hypothetical protein
MEITSLISKITQLEDYRIVQITNETIIFHYIQNQTLTKTIKLNIGIQTITSKYFIKEAPSEAEVEYAINDIEDELMSSKDLVNVNENLYTNDGFIIEVVKVSKNTITNVSRQAIEEIFTKYALVSMGRSPIYDDIKMDKEKYAGLLILREILHHLNFKDIGIINQ